MNIRKARNGYALASVLVVFVVLSILIISAITVVQANTKQIVHQDDNLRGYYLARSGVDIAYAALMQEDSGTYEKIMDRLIAENVEIEHAKLDLPISDPIGSVNIKVSYNSTSKEIEIKVISTMESTNQTYSLSCYINESTGNIVRWER